MKELSSTINCMDGIKFEKFGHTILEMILKKKLHHKGQNLNGSPVGYTVDTLSDDAKIVGEYSVEKDYFSNHKKPLKDINHVITNHPKVEIIYLFSSCSSTPSQSTSFSNFINNQENHLKIKIVWFDANDIARYIKNDLSSNLFNLNKIKNYFPDSCMNLIYNKMQQYSINLPSNYYGEYQEPLNIVKVNNIISISGPSGIGKTTLAQKIIKELFEDSNIYIEYFFYANKIENSYTISNNISNECYNLLSLLSSQKNIIIFFDDLANLPSEFYNNVKPYLKDNYIVITSIYNNLLDTNFCYECSVPSDENAEKILNYRLKNKCTEKELLQSIFTKTSKYPLFLEILRKYKSDYEEESWEKIIEEIMDMESADGKLVTSKIVEKYSDKLECNELECLMWLDNNYICYDLLKKLLKTVNVNKLLKRSLIKRSGNVVIIHNIVLSSIKSKIDLSDELSEHFTKKLYNFLNEKNKKKDGSYYVALYLHKKLLKDIYLNTSCDDLERNHEKLYYYISASKTSSLEKIENIDIDLLITDIKAGRDTYGFALKSLVEIQELNLLNCAKEMKSIVINNSINQLEEVKKCYAVPLLSFINHHLGKLYLKNNQLDKAEILINQVLLDNPNAYETKLQLARLKKNQGLIQELSNIVSGLINAYICKNDISISIVLSAYEELKNCDDDTKKKYLYDEFEYFKTAFASIVVDNYERPYRVLASLKSAMSYNYSDQYLQLFELLSDVDISKVPINKHAEIANIYHGAGDASTDYTLRKKYYDLANMFYLSIYNAKVIDEYQLLQYMNFLQSDGVKKYREALDLYNENNLSGNYFGEYRAGKSCYFLGYNSEAKSHFCEAEKIMHNNRKYEKYASSLYHFIALNSIKLNDTNELITKYFNLALDKASDKYKSDIKEDFNKYIKDINDGD